MKYNIMPSVGLSQIETRIADIFSMAKICHMTSHNLSARLNEQIIDPLNYRTPSGKRRHSVWFCGYAAGIIARMRSEIWQQHVEFCYDIGGILYSTHTDSDKPSTDHFYGKDISGLSELFTSENGRHYWKHTDKPYS